MSKVIRISIDVFERLQKYATPLVDSPSDVIKHLLDAYESRVGDSFPMADSDKGRDQIKVTNRGSLVGSSHGVVERTKSGTLSERFLKKVLLIALLRDGGGSEAVTALRNTEKILEGLGALRDVDVEISSKRNNWERWETNTRFARKHLHDEGLLKHDSRRGWWELSARGREMAARLITEIDL